MSHPVNRRDRFQKGILKSKKRVSNFYIYMEKEDRILLKEKHSRRYRSVTKLCSAPRCCGNPRRYFNDLPIQEKKYGSGKIYIDE